MAEVTEQQDELSVETAFQELDRLADRLEDQETSLEESFALYKKGMELLKYCSEKLDTVEKKMLQINEDGTFSEFSKRITGKNKRSRRDNLQISAEGGRFCRSSGRGYELQRMLRGKKASPHTSW